MRLSSQINLVFSARELPIFCVPILYIAAVTSVSRGEVHGGSRRSFYLPFALYGVVVAALLAVSFLTRTPLWQSLPFLAFFVYLIFPPLVRAYRDPQPRHIGLAVKAGVIALIAMDAAIAAAFAGWLYGLLVLALLPVSRLLARAFAVT
jgi:4-hydroxybenzoate polyprenyltransferase